MTSGLSLKMVGLLAETPVHVGVGQAADVIDLPVAREAVTRFPHVPGSGVKGAFRVWFNEANGYYGRRNADEEPDASESTSQSEPKITKLLFGKGDDDGGDASGLVLFGEARLALLPVRAIRGSVRWVTCPLILNRLARDVQRITQRTPFMVPKVDRGKYLGFEDEENLGLEEREFSAADETEMGDIAQMLYKLAPTLLTLADGEKKPDMACKRKVAILSDEDFCWFAINSLPVAMRNKLNDRKTVVPGALWSEETVPADTIFWTLIGERSEGAAKSILDTLAYNPYIQMGGNETIGQGWFRTAEVSHAAA